MLTPVTTYYGHARNGMDRLKVRLNLEVTKDKPMVVPITVEQEVDRLLRETVDKIEYIIFMKAKEDATN